MRTLVQIRLRSGSDKINTLEEWLRASSFGPESFELPNEWREALLNEDRPARPSADPSPSVAAIHAFDILASIPRDEEERHHALDTSKLVISCADQHGHFVWGLVCVHSDLVAIRWRYALTRSLEQATEELVSRIWESSVSMGLFTQFAAGHVIPVREPLSTRDAYYGEVLPKGRMLKQRAREERKSEWWISWVMAGATIAFFAMGFILFSRSSPDSLLRWVAGAFDRLATTAAATMVVSYLSYYLFLRDLQRKAIIDWK